MAARDGGCSKDLARRLTEALGRSEKDFVKTLMEAVRERGVQLTADEIGTTRFVLHKYIREGQRPRFSMLIKMVAACGVKFVLAPST
jgi:DNA-binding phage protein